MFARIFAVASLAVLVMADSTCNSGSLNCCNSVQQASTVGSIMESLGLANVLAGVTGEVGLGCAPITVVGTGAGAQCTQQTACCEGDTYNGFINMGCSPISANA